MKNRYSRGQKYRHPCNSVRKCSPSLRKFLQLQMFWSSHVYCFCKFGTTQKNQKKSQIWYNSTQNALDKIIATLNLIFGSTPFGKNNWNQSLPVTMNEFLAPLYWNFGPLFFCKLLQVIQIWRMPSPNCCFEISPQMLGDSDLDSLLAISELSSALFVTISECFLKCFGSLSCRKTHDLWWRRSFLTLATTLPPKILW